MKLSLRERIAIALDIVKGRDSGRIGGVIECSEFTKEDGSPAHHWASWNLETASPESNCDGTVKKVSV